PEEASVRQTLSALIILYTCAVPLFSQDTPPRGPKPDRVVITPRVAEAEAGQQMTFTAAGYDEANTKLDAKASAWVVTPFDLGYPDANANVTFVAPGEVRVGAFVNGKPGFLPVMVKPQPVAKIQIKAPSLPIPSGTGVALSATTLMTNGDPRTDIQVKWSSSN